MKFSRGSYWFTSGSYTLLEKISLQLFRFGGFYLLVRSLSQAEFGVWVLFLIIGAFIEMARAGLIQNALLRHLAPAHPAAQGYINTASLVLNVLLTILSLLGLLLLAQTYTYFWNAPLLESLLYYYMLTTTALIPFFQFNFIQQANQDFKGIFYSNFVREGLFFAYVLYAYVDPSRGIHLAELAMFQVVAAIAGSFVSYWLARKYLIFSHLLDLRWMQQLFGYGKFVFGTNMGSMLIKSLDQMMLGALAGPVAVAIYSTSVKISNLIEIPTQAMAAMVFPVSARRMETGGKQAVRALYEKSVGSLLALIFPGLLFIWSFPAWFLKFVAGSAYLEAVPILRVTLLFGLFVPFARQFGTMLDSIGKPRINFYMILMSVCLNFIFNYLFILQWGTIGAAYGTLLTYVIVFVGNQVILYRELGVNTLHAFLHIWTFYRVGIQLAYKLIRKKAGAYA